jgi:hypothetical protein
MSENPQNTGISSLDGGRGNVVDSSAAVSTSASDTKRPPGRLPGIKKTPGSGRKKGTRNRCSEVGRVYILDRGRPLSFLCDLAAGRQVSVADPKNPAKKIKVYPDLKERRAAAATLAPMITPMLKSTDFQMTARDGANLNFEVVLVKPNKQHDDDRMENSLPSKTKG